MDKLITLALVLAVPTAAAYWLRSKWQLDSIHGVAFEIVARTLPGPARSVPGLRRTLARRVCATPIVMPSGRVKVHSLIEVRVSEPDYETLDAVFGCAEIERDLATVCRDHARREHWELPSHGPMVRLTPDLVLHQGWVPRARAMGTGASTNAEQHHLWPMDDLEHDTRLTAVDDTHLIDGVSDVVTKRVMPALVVTDGTGVEAVLADRQPEDSMLKDPIVIGRSSRADLSVNDEQASRRHAQFTCDRAGWMLTDLGSTNGTWLNGARVYDHPVRVTVGDTIRLGKHGPALVVKVATPLSGETKQAHHRG